MRLILLLPFAAVMGLLLFAAPTRADYLYAFDPINPTVYSDLSGMGIDLSDGYQSSSPVSGAVHNVVANHLLPFVNLGTTGSDAFTQGQSAGLRVTLIDGTERASVEFLFGFTGMLSAEFSDLAVSFRDGSSKSLTLNGQTYTISLTAPPLLPGDLLASIIPDAPGDPDPGSGPGSPSPTAPEPTSACLAGIASALLVAARAWTRRP